MSLRGGMYTKDYDINDGLEPFIRNQKRIDKRDRTKPHDFSVQKSSHLE